jgi:MFS/sugar transport protein
MAVEDADHNSSGRPQKLTVRNYLGYATGDAANNLAFSMAGMFLLLYYTNVIGVGAAALGTMFLLIRFWDALADLVVGRLVDAKSQAGSESSGPLSSTSRCPCCCPAWRSSRRKSSSRTSALREG